MRNLVERHAEDEAIDDAVGIVARDECLQGRRVAEQELLPNPRWRRLSGGFREVGALLLLVVPADAPRLRDLVDTTDGIVIVGDVAPPDVPVAQALAWLRPRRPSSAAPREAPLAVITATHGRRSTDRRRLVAAGRRGCTSGPCSRGAVLVLRPALSGRARR